MLSEVQLLNRSKKYRVRDRDEAYWYCVYGRDKTNGLKGWWVFLYEAGSAIVQPKGRWTEQKVFDLLNEHGHSLTEDDSIDFHVWLKGGGLENLLAELKTARKSAKKLTEIIQSEPVLVVADGTIQGEAE